MCKVEIKKSNRSGKKLVAQFTSCKDGKIVNVHFGASGMSDYTKHHDDERKERYIARHSKREDWDNPMTAGSLSRYILWNKHTIEESIKDFKNRFDLD